MIDAPETETQRVFESIKAQILRKQYPPGTPLSHSQLCRDLNTSRTPVREALSRLEGLGLVSTVPHRGTFVARLDLQDFLEITQIRMLLEPFAAAQAAETIPPRVVIALIERLDALNHEHPSDSDFEALHQIDAEIHRAIGQACGNRRIDGLTETLRNLCEQFSYDSQVRFSTMVGELHELLAALRDADSATAEAVMRRHITNFGEALPRLIAR